MLMNAVIRATFLNPTTGEKLHVDHKTYKTSVATKTINTTSNHRKFRTDCKIGYVLDLTGKPLIHQINDENWDVFRTRDPEWCRIERVVFETENGQDEYDVSELRNAIERFLNGDSVSAFTSANAVAKIRYIEGDPQWNDTDLTYADEWVAEWYN